MSSNVFKAVQVTDKVWWVGVVDWTLRDFHGYATSRGSTYNAYLVMDEKITLIDTVKRPHMDEFLARIGSVVDPKDISVVISNHSEMDHSGSLPPMLDLIQPDEVYASTMGVKALESHFGLGDAVQAVKSGETISLGSSDVTFVETRMLHWPDSMCSYLSGENVLFSQDAFGMHLASYERFAGEIPGDILYFEGAKYFANILTPYARLIPNAIETIAGLGVPIDIIAPDHGPIWRTENNTAPVVDWYGKWAAQRPTGKAVVVYSTMWESTAKMARAYGEGLASAGVTVKLLPLKGSHRSDVATELLEAGALVAGTPTMNNMMFPEMADAMNYLQGLRFRNLLGGVFGSHGWSGEGVKQLEGIFDAMGVDRVESVVCQYVPDGTVLEKCYMTGVELGEKLLQAVRTA